MTVPMNKTVTLSNGEKVMFLVADSASIMAHRSDSSFRRSDVTVNAMYTIARAAWKQCGVYPTRITQQPAGECTWVSQYFPGITFKLYGMAWVDGEHDLEEEHSNYWVVKVSKPLRNIPGALDDSDQITDEFEDAYTSGLWDYGFTTASPNYSWSPTGFMFCVHYVRMSKHSRTLLVENKWARDV